MCQSVVKSLGFSFRLLSLVILSAARYLWNCSAAVHDLLLALMAVDIFFLSFYESSYTAAEEKKEKTTETVLLMVQV